MAQLEGGGGGGKCPRHIEDRLRSQQSSDKQNLNNGGKETGNRVNESRNDIESVLSSLESQLNHLDEFRKKQESITRDLEGKVVEVVRNLNNLTDRSSDAERRVYTKIKEMEIKFDNCLHELIDETRDTIEKQIKSLSENMKKLRKEMNSIKINVEKMIDKTNHEQVNTADASIQTHSSLEEDPEHFTRESKYTQDHDSTQGHYRMIDDTTEQSKSPAEWNTTPFVYPPLLWLERSSIRCGSLSEWIFSKQFVCWSRIFTR